ncbi:MAG: hypothetical protein QXK54_05455 [Ignisphaera sp.]
MDRMAIVMLSIASVLIVLSIPLAVYLTYPIDQQEPVEQIVEDAFQYLSIPRPPPRFIHGVYGYTALRGSRIMIKGFFMWRDSKVGVLVVNGDLVPTMFMSRYKSLDEEKYIDGEELARYMNGTKVVSIGYLFRTPRGLMFIPVEVYMDSIRFVYIPR